MQRGTGGGVLLDEEELELLEEEELELLDEEDEEDELEEDDELELLDEEDEEELDEEEDELDELELPDEDEDELELLGSELDDEEPGKPDEDELEEEESMAIRSGREREIASNEEIPTYLKGNPHLGIRQRISTKRRAIHDIVTEPPGIRQAGPSSRLPPQPALVQ